MDEQGELPPKPIRCTKEKWDEFYSNRGNQACFDWYADWSQLRDTILSHLSLPSRLLVAGCGKSQISELLHNNGFKITNIDFSKVVIKHMMGRKPELIWSFMDMTKLKFKDKSFDAILDKGAIDSLMESDIFPKLGNLYLSEVSRVLETRGSFLCVTLAKAQVLVFLFRKFRFGWKTSLHAIPKKPVDKPTQQIFMLVGEKDTSTDVHLITLSFDRSSLNCNSTEACGLYEAFDKENNIRRKYLNGYGSEITYSLEDLQLGVKGDLLNLSSGRRIQLTLGEQGGPSYRSIILDALESNAPPQNHCQVLVVPKTMCHEGLSSKEQQWHLVKELQTARLIMVFFEPRHDVSADAVVQELHPFIEQLEPVKPGIESEIKYTTLDKGTQDLEDHYKGTTSNRIGPITIKTVEYEIPPKKIRYRHLSFARAEGFVQEGLLNDAPSKKKSSDSSIVYHPFLASPYHVGIISGFQLISSYLKSMASSKKTVKIVVSGLGAGVLPMFIHECMPLTKIEVLERDLILPSIASQFFGFSESSRLKICRKEVVEFVVANTEPVDILIIDVHRMNESRHVLACPPSALVEQSFFERVKNCLSKQGVFILNIVIRSPPHKCLIYARMKEVFSSVFCYEVVEDFHEILFGYCSEVKDLHQACAIILDMGEMREEVIKTVDQFNRLK